MNIVRKIINASFIAASLWVPFSAQGTENMDHSEDVPPRDSNKPGSVPLASDSEADVSACVNRNQGEVVPFASRDSGLSRSVPPYPGFRTGLEDYEDMAQDWDVPLNTAIHYSVWGMSVSLWGGSQGFAVSTSIWLTGGHGALEARRTLQIRLGPDGIAGGWQAPNGYVFLDGSAEKTVRRIGAGEYEIRIVPEKDMETLGEWKAYPINMWIKGFHRADGVKELQIVVVPFGSEPFIDTAEGRKPVDGLESDITELIEGKLVVKMFAKRGLFGSMRYPGVINCEDGGVLMQFGGLSDERIRRLDEMIRRFEAMNPNLAKK